MIKQTRSEIIKFIVTGIICFLIEFIVLVLLRDRIGLSTLAATPIAFLISVFVNYLFCVKWVFTEAKGQRISAKVGFLITSIMGLLFNELFMWLFGTLFGEDQIIMKVLSFSITMYMINKVLSTLIVMIWNFITKKWILNHKGC